MGQCRDYANLKTDKVYLRQGRGDVGVKKNVRERELCKGNRLMRRSRMKAKGGEESQGKKILRGGRAGRRFVVPQGRRRKKKRREKTATPSKATQPWVRPRGGVNLLRATVDMEVFWHGLCREKCGTTSASWGFQGCKALG